MSWRVVPDGVRADGPDGGDPGEVRGGGPKLGDVVPGAGAGLPLDFGAVLEREQGGVADEEGGVGGGEHGDGVGGSGGEARLDAEEVAEEELGVGGRRAGSGVGRDGADLRERQLADELDGTDRVEAGDGAVGDDGELGGEGGDGDEAEVGLAGEELGGALGRQHVVEVVAGVGGEVPHERGGVEEVDGGYAERHKGSVRQPKAVRNGERRRAW